ncbi:MAG: restriction endonuclease subunit S [Methanococcoides sp.]|nr:restriction endonuclease subunit S [Methanococcoides sp.]
MSSNVPQLRFPEFEEEWESKKLGDVFKTRSDIGDFEDLPLFSLTIKNGVIAKPTQYEREHLVNNDNAYKKTVNNDFVYNPMNLRFGALKVYKGNIAVRVSKYYDIFYTDEETKFWEEYLLTYNSLHYYNKMAEGTLEEKKRVHYSNFINFIFLVPILPEQQKIATFLTSVDERLQALKKKKELLEQYKKGAMQKLFSQELRFKQDDGSAFPDWEEKKLGKLGSFLGGGTPDSSKKEYWEGNIPWISSSDIKDDNIHKINITRFITEEAINESATKIIPKNSILIVSRVGIGKFAVAEQDLCTSQDFTNLVTSENSYFLAYYFNAQSTRFVRLSQGTSIKGFTSKDIKGVKFAIPAIPEQEKIATFLSAIDDKISSCQSQIDGTTEWKKGLLQNMFV